MLCIAKQACSMIDNQDIARLLYETYMHITIEYINGYLNEYITRWFVEPHIKRTKSIRYLKIYRMHHCGKYKCYACTQYTYGIDIQYTYALNHIGDTLERTYVSKYDRNCVLCLDCILRCKLKYRRYVIDILKN